MKRAALILIASLLGFLGLEALVFRSGLYIIVADPNSTTGYMGLILHNEEIREKVGPNQVLGIGDSRMALVTRVANGLTPETGYSFGTISVAGTTPRCWYYMLRSTDPNANRYRAILIGIDSYDDQESVEDYSNRESDLNYVLDELGYADIAEFSGSYHDPALRSRARRAIVLKGLLLKRDFQQLLLNPWARVRDALQSRRNSHIWIYDYLGPTRSMTGLEVDFERKILKPPPDADAGLEAALKDALLGPLPPDEGRRSTYLKYWFGRIRDHYRNSATRVIFLRLPRGPKVRPDFRPTNPNSSVRLLASEPNITLLSEDFFNGLELPENFQDQMHLNRGGLNQFSTMLARETRKILGPPQ